MICFGLNLVGCMEDFVEQPWLLVVCCRMAFSKVCVCLFLCISLACAQAPQEQPVPTRIPGGNTQCGLCNAFVSAGRINASSGCTQPGCGYCTLQSVAACTDLTGPLHSGFCVGTCSGGEGAPVSFALIDFWTQNVLCKFLQL